MSPVWHTYQAYLRSARSRAESAGERPESGALGSAPEPEPSGARPEPKPYAGAELVTDKEGNR